MVAASSAVEVLVIGAIELVNSIEDVLARMRVHDVEQDGQAHRMRGIHKLFELFGCTISGACSEEACDLVSESLSKKGLNIYASEDNDISDLQA